MIFKVLNSILAVCAIIACLAAVGVIAYSIFQPDLSGIVSDVAAAIASAEEDASTSPNPDASASGDDATQSSDPSPSEHVHNYVASVYKEATCTTDGTMIYMCDCGAFYYETIPATGHTPGDWQVQLIPTRTSPGLRTQSCTVCGALLASEVLPAIGDGSSSSPDPNASPSASPHVHNYVISIDRDKLATCTQNGIRRYTCSCGSFYTESIPANGHLSDFWQITSPTVTTEGVRQRSCVVCNTLIDSQTIAKLRPGTITPTICAHPTTTSYVYREANCISIGARTIKCDTCGDEKQEPIPIDLTKHSYDDNNICTLCGATKPSPSPSSSGSPNPNASPNPSPSPNPTTRPN
jgi:hypothetical protein